MIPDLYLATPIHITRDSKRVRKQLRRINFSPEPINKTKIKRKTKKVAMKPIQIVYSLIKEQNLYNKRFKGEHAAIDRKRDGERKKLEKRFKKQINSIIRRAEEKHANLEKKSIIEFQEIEKRHRKMCSQESMPYSFRSYFIIRS